MILTVELESGKSLIKSISGEVAICFDREGLDLLVSKLNLLREKVDHIHLMTPSWSGNELTEKCQGGEDFSLIHHLRLVRIP